MSGDVTGDASGEAPFLALAVGAVGGVFVGGCGRGDGHGVAVVGPEAGEAGLEGAFEVGEGVVDVGGKGGPGGGERRLVGLVWHGVGLNSSHHPLVLRVRAPAAQRRRRKTAEKAGGKNFRVVCFSLNPVARFAPRVGSWAVRHRSLILLLVLNLLTYMDRQVLAGVESLIARDLLPADAHAQGKMGLLATAFLVSYMVFSPAFGILGDRTSRWLLVGLGTVVGSLATGATGLAGTFAMIVAARVVVGISEAAYAPVAPTLLADMYPVERRGLVLACFYAAIPVGSALGYAWGGLVSDALSWHWAFLLLAPPGILAGGLAMLMKDSRRKGRAGAGNDSRPLSEGRPLYEGALSEGANGRNDSRPLFVVWRELVRIRSYRLNVLGQTAMTFAIGGIAFWMPRYIHGRYLAEVSAEAKIGGLNFAFGALTAATGLTATLVGGWVADKLRGKVRGSYFVVSAGGMLVGFVCFLATLSVPFPWAWVPLGMTVFFLFLNTGPANTALANVTPPPLRATAFALSIFVLHALGDAISPPLIGAIADRAGLQAGMLFTSLAFVGAAVFWMLAAKTLEADTAKVEAAYPAESGRGAKGVAEAVAG